METRASYVAIGAFVLALLGGIVVAVLWFMRGQLAHDMKRYETYFQSVSFGLTSGSPVRVSGVQLGHVVSVTLDPENPTRVRVTMDIASSAPIRSDSVASLEIQSLAGTSAIEITPGSEGAPPIVVHPGQRYPVIWSRQSNLDQIVNAVPNLLAKVSDLTDELRATLGSRNRRALTETLDNLSRLTATAAAHRGDLARLLSDGAADARDLHQAIANLDIATRKFDRVADQTGAAVRNINDVVQEDRGPLKDFTHNGLRQLQQLTVDTRGLVAQLSRAVDAFNRDPSRLIYGDRRVGYRPQ